MNDAPDPAELLTTQFLDSLDERLSALVTEAVGHRQSVADRTGLEGPAELHATLRLARGASDRVEGILVSLTLARGRAEALRAKCQEELDDSWTESATSTRASFVHGDAAPRERYAQYDLAAMPQRKRLRVADRLLEDVRTTIEAVRLIHRGLNDTRQDISTSLRAISIESSLER